MTNLEAATRQSFPQLNDFFKAASLTLSSVNLCLFQLTAAEMESLSDEVWDVVIAGTGIPQSLLAL